MENGSGNKGSCLSWWLWGLNEVLQKCQPPVKLCAREEECGEVHWRQPGEERNLLESEGSGLQSQLSHLRVQNSWQVTNHPHSSRLSLRPQWE